MELLGVILGSVLTLSVTWLTSARRIKAHWSAIQAEMMMCYEMAGTYLAEADQMRFIAPSYRLPTSAFDASFVVLLAEADMSSHEATILTRFWAKVQEVNRGLDNVDELRKAELLKGGSNESRAYEPDVKRLILKCTQIRDRTEQPIYEPALSVVTRKIARPWWQVLANWVKA